MLRLAQPLAEEAKPVIFFAFQMIVAREGRIVNGGEKSRQNGGVKNAAGSPRGSLPAD
jgi:hypothetical protein